MELILARLTGHAVIPWGGPFEGDVIRLPLSSGQAWTDRKRDRQTSGKPERCGSKRHALLLTFGCDSHVTRDLVFYSNGLCLRGTRSCPRAEFRGHSGCGSGKFHSSQLEIAFSRPA